MPFVTNSVHGLSLGDLIFVENGANKTYTDAPSGETYTFNVLAPDTTWGNAQPITTTLLSLMKNGSPVVHLRDENREPAISLTIEASGPAGLAAAEVALVKAVGKPAELRWQPPSAASALTVFDVVWSHLEHQMDSAGERYLRRSYMIRLQALPYARSATKVITAAVATASPTVVDSGSATTNWTINSPAGATLSVVSGAVRSTYNPATSTGGFYGSSLRRTASLTTTSKYLAVDWKSSIPSVYGLQTSATSTNLPEVRREPAATAGYNRSWFKIPDSVSSVSWFQFGIVHPAGSGSATLEIDQVLIATTLPNPGSGRQQLRTIDPGGSVPANGTILVQHPSGSLGQVIVFSHPVMGGYSPPLRQWLTSSSAVTTDATFVSGAWNALDTISTFKVPNSAIPEGPTQLWARLGCNAVTSVDVNWSIYAALPGTAIGSVILTGVTRVTFSATFSYKYYPLANFPLPIAKSGAAGMTMIEIQAGNSTSPIVFLDEAYLFATEKGRLTIVDCGVAAPSPGGSSNRLKISAPSLNEPNGSIMVGNAADWSDAFVPSASVVAVDQTEHTLDPDGSFVLTVTPTVTAAEVSFEHYPGHHTHAVG